MTKQRILILAEGKFDIFNAKTAVGVIRYRKEEVVGIIDRFNTGKDAASLIGIGKNIPVVSNVAEAMPLQPTDLLIGIAPPGGTLPVEWRNHITDAIRNKLNIVSGLHCYLGEDPQFLQLARDHEVNIRDVRKSPKDIGIGTGRAKETRTLRILTVGSDCNVGKMLTSLEVTHAAKKEGINACFVATGQTGIMIEGSGIAVDHVLSDFISGAAEKLVLDRAHFRLLSIEGQGSVIHPAYSGVTLGLLHGTAPQGLILCHQPARKILRHTKFPMLPLHDLIELYEKLAQPFYPCKVLGISLNSYGMSEHDALQEIRNTEKETKLPATDPVRFGVAKFLDVIRPLLP
ncbi:MAG: DUF1611 domain-containing protein [Candidatus Loosdrechtia sp.]|uniref:DUF1611 domain-containing protein n=1 Tax=Candidatus Loosdrechtia sp. TaxID=3101272 RepID=UPI003A5EF167|nr:MAG: DUF1611 domain-containing protein [Candidatus Jettenia sp. AMX2]